MRPRGQDNNLMRRPGTEADTNFTGSLVSDFSNSSIIEKAQQVQDDYNPQQIFAQLEQDLSEKSQNFKMGENYHPYSHNDGIFTLAGPISDKNKDRRIKKCPSCHYPF